MKSLDLAKPGEREFLHKKGIWVTAEKLKIPVTDMSDKHMARVIKFLINKAKGEADLGVSEMLALPMPRGEMAQDMYFYEIDMIEAGVIGWESWFDSYPIVPFLFEEIDKRGILEYVQNYL